MTSPDGRCGIWECESSEDSVGVGCGASSFFGTGAGRACSAASFQTKAADAIMGISTSSSPRRFRILSFPRRAYSLETDANSGPAALCRAIRGLRDRGVSGCDSWAADAGRYVVRYCSAGRRAKDCHGWPTRSCLVADFRARATRIVSSGGSNMLRFIAGFAGACALLSSATLLAQSPATSETPAAPAAQPNDYSKREFWLCTPAGKDSCAVDLATTVVAPSGKFTKEKFKAPKDAPIDCFYVYPTVSLDQSGNSDMIAGPEEQNVIAQQFARFSSVCRVYAPLYRQVTL